MEERSANNSRDQLAMVSGFSGNAPWQPTPAERERDRDGVSEKETQTEMRYVSLLIWGRRVREIESRRSGVGWRVGKINEQVGQMMAGEGKGL